MGLLPPVVQEIKVTADQAIAAWSKYAAAAKAALEQAAAAAEAEATRMEEAARKAAVASESAATSAAAAAAKVATASDAASAKAKASADAAAAALEEKQAALVALQAEGTASAEELQAATDRASEAYVVWFDESVRANQVMAEATAATAEAGERASKIAADGATEAEAAATAARVARAQANEAAAALEGNALTSTTALGGLRKAGDKALLGVVATLGIVGYESVKTAGTFDESMKLVQTGAGESAANVAKLAPAVEAMAGPTATSANTLAQSMYVVAASIGAIAGPTHTTAQELTILQAAAQGAKTDGADTVAVTKALTTVMADLHAPVADAADVMSKMVTAVGEGKMRMDDLATAIPQVLPKATALGIGFDQVGGALATMTAEGMSAEQSAQNLNNVIIMLAKPTTAMTKAMAAYGVSSLDVSEKLGQRGLTGTLSLLYDAVIKQSKGGVALQNAFAANKVAAEGLITMFAKLPPTVQKLATEYEHGTIGAKAYRTEAMNLGGTTGVMALQFKAAFDSAGGFSQALRSGKGDLQTMTGGLADMTGGMTGLSVATALTGKNMATFQDNVTKIKTTTAEADGSVKNFNTAMQTWPNTLAEVQDNLGALGIEIGHDLIPALTSSVHFFEQHTTTLKVLVGVIGGVATGLAAYSLTMKIHDAVVGTVDAATTAYDWTLKKLGVDTSAAAEETATLNTQFLASDSRMSGLAAGVGKAALAYVALAAADSAFSHNASVGVNQATTSLEKWVNTGKSASDLTGNLDRDIGRLQSGFLDLGSAQHGVAEFLSGDLHLGFLMGGQDVRQSDERIQSLDASLASLVQDGHMSEAAKAWAKLTDVAKSQGTSVDELKAAFPQYTEALAGAKNAATQAATAQEKLNAALDSSQNVLLNTRSAQSAYYSAIDATTRALQDDGKGLDVTTQKGRDNRDALDAQAKASLDYLQALQQNGASAATFNATIDASRAALVKAAEQFGLTKAQALQYVNQLLAIPKQVTTTPVLNAAGVDAQIAALQGRLAGLNGVLTVTPRTGTAGQGLGVYKADGGLIPGSPSDVDTVPAMLAEGEFVVNSKATSRNLTLLQAINSGKIAAYASGGQVRGYASGGHVSSSSGTAAMAASIRSAMTTVGKWIPESIAKGVETNRQAAIIEMQRLGAQIVATGSGYATNLVKGMQPQFIQLATLHDSLTAKMKAAKTSLAQLEADSSKLASDTTSKIVSGVDIPSTQATLDTATQDAIDNAQKLQTAADKAALQASKDAQRAQLTGTASAALTASQSAAAAKTAADAAAAAQQQADQMSGTSADDVSASIISNMHTAINTAQQFGQAIAALKKQGLNSTSLQQIVDAGPTQGLQTANALLQSGQTAVDQVNALEKQLQVIATQTGTTVSGAMYGAGIQAAQGLVKGLTSQESAVTSEITKLADTLVTQVKKDLKIKSPSGRFADEVGAQIPAGVLVGVKKGIPALHAGMAGMFNGTGRVSIGGLPTTGAGQAVQVVVNHTTTLDGKVLEKSTRKSTVQRARRNTSNGLSLPGGR